jgi:hypothetical protein
MFLICPNPPPYDWEIKPDGTGEGQGMTRADLCRADCDCPRCRPAKDEADLLRRLPPTDCDPEEDIPFG